MNTPKQIILIRHAESERNKALEGGALFITDPAQLEKVGKVPDHKIGLTEKGHEQARTTSKFLIEHFGPPEIIFYSGYARTKQTAEGILSGLAVKPPLIENLLIRERENGYTHTLLQDDKEKHFPYLQDYWDIVGGIFARPVGGESLLDVIEKRLRPFLEYLNKNYAGKNVVLVTHGRVIQCLRFLLLGASVEEMETFIGDPKNAPLNCSISVFENVQSGEMDGDGFVDSVSNNSKNVDVDTGEHWEMKQWNRAGW